MKIPEHDIIEAKWLIARATFAAKPREEERRAAADELLGALLELHGLHGLTVERSDRGVRLSIPGGKSTSVDYADGALLLRREDTSHEAPIAYDAGLRSYVGPEVSDAQPGRNGTRPRIPALVALVRAVLGGAAEVGPSTRRPISLRGG